MVSVIPIVRIEGILRDLAGIAALLELSKHDQNCSGLFPAFFILSLYAQRIFSFFRHSVDYTDTLRLRSTANDRHE